MSGLHMTYWDDVDVALSYLPHDDRWVRAVAALDHLKVRTSENRCELKERVEAAEAELASSEAQVDGAELRCMAAETDNARLREAAAKVADAYTAEAEDHNDGEFALWKADDLVNAIVTLRAALAGKEGT